MLDKDNKHILILKKNKQDAINAAWQKERQDSFDLDIYLSEIDRQNANIISACHADIQCLRQEITNLQTEDVLFHNHVDDRTFHHNQLQASAKKHALAIEKTQRETSEELAKQRETIQHGRNAVEDALTKIEEQSAKIVSLKKELFESNLYSLDWQTKFDDLKKSAPRDIQAAKDEMTQNTVEPLHHEISDLKAQISDLRHATESQIQNAVDGVNTDKVEPLQHEITILTDDNSKLISDLESVRASIPKETSIAVNDIQIKMVQPLQQQLLQSKQLQSKLTPELRDTQQSISGQTEDAERQVDIKKVQPLRRDIIKLKNTKIRLSSELEVPQHSIPGYVRQAVDEVETNKIKPLRRKIQALKTRKREFESSIQDLQNSIPQAIEEAADLVEMETIEPLRKEVLSLYTREKNLESQLLLSRTSLPGTIRAAKEKLTETKPRPLREKCINLVNNNSLLETEIVRVIRISRPDPDKMERAVARGETDQVMPLKECDQDLKTQCEDLEAQLQAREDSYRETIDALNKKICLQVDEILKSASQIHENEVKFTRLEETIVSHEETITELKLTVANQEKTIAELHLEQEEGVDSQVTKILDIHRQQPVAQIAQIERIAEPPKLVQTLAQDRYPFEPHKSRHARLSPETRRWASSGPCPQQKLKLDESPPPSSSAHLLKWNTLWMRIGQYQEFQGRLSFANTVTLRLGRVYHQRLCTGTSAGQMMPSMFADGKIVESDRD